jgi:hypothetical protein
VPATKKQMIKKIIFVLLLSCIGWQKIMAQDSTSTFYPEANGTIGKRTHVNAVSFSTQNTTAPFLEVLRKKFRVLKNDGEFLRFSGYNKNWSKDKLIIRVSSLVQINLDKSKTNAVFIFVETVNGYDLLQPQRSSCKKIIQYFSGLFTETIKNGKPDDF